MDIKVTLSTPECYQNNMTPALGVWEHAMASLILRQYLWEKETVRQKILALVDGVRLY